ncbi:MAG TPA: DUF2975 domain-containing protein [Methylotenera sp.]|nr:DUF2975 domain-containing protein [Methylotenera sp.]HPN01969.1 DUF2975 domain-containing protein [Methylotenera sp.]
MDAYKNVKNSLTTLLNLTNCETNQMNIQNNKQHPQHIYRLSQFMSTFCLMLIIVLPVAVAVFWTFAETETLAIRVNLPLEAVQGSLRSWQRTLGCVLSEIPLALLLIGVWEARKCFRLFTRGTVFTPEAVYYLKSFSGWSMASVIAEFICGTAISTILTLENPNGARSLILNLDSDQVLLLFFAGLVWLMADVISQGQTIAEENSKFI